MRIAMSSTRRMIAALAAGALLTTAACKPEISTAFNPQLDGLNYQQPAQPDLSYLGDQKALHPAPLRNSFAPSAPAPSPAPAAAPSAPISPSSAATSTAPASSAPAAAPFASPG